MHGLASKGDANDLSGLPVKRDVGIGAAPLSEGSGATPRSQTMIGWMAELVLRS
jgi:hypothetical protein